MTDVATVLSLVAIGFSIAALWLELRRNRAARPKAPVEHVTAEDWYREWRKPWNRFRRPKLPPCEPVSLVAPWDTRLTWEQTAEPLTAEQERKRPVSAEGVDEWAEMAEQARNSGPLWFPPMGWNAPQERQAEGGER
jgi:hypothetical protein